MFGVVSIDLILMIGVIVMVFMLSMYCVFVMLDSVYVSYYVLFIGFVGSGDNWVFYCMVGKDCIGWVIVILYLIFGIFG